MTPRIVLTGASRGIGNAILQALALGGHSVLGLSRTKPEAINASESDHIAWQRLDLSNSSDVTRCVSSLQGVSIRALILCAVDYGANERHPTLTTSAQEWQQVIGTTCIGQCQLVSGLLPKLTADPPGIIVNLSSDVALLPGSGRAAYAASKAGLHAALRAVAAEHSPESLRVYQLVPTFQMITSGIRRRRPADFDFSTYADPSLIAKVVAQLVGPTSNSTVPGTYLVLRDGTMEGYAEKTRLLTSEG